MGWCVVAAAGATPTGIMRRFSLGFSGEAPLGAGRLVPAAGAFSLQLEVLSGVPLPLLGPSMVIER